MFLYRKVIPRNTEDFRIMHTPQRYLIEKASCCYQRALVGSIRLQEILASITFDALYRTAGSTAASTRFTPFPAETPTDIRFRSNDGAAVI